MEEEKYEYDKYGRMRYHPDFHFKHGELFTAEELEYLCKFHHHDHNQSLAFALGKTEGIILNKLRDLKKCGLYEYYKNRGLYY
jgi:hypothetical protein